MAARDPAITKAFRSGCWEAECGTIRDGREAFKRMRRHGRRQAGKKELARALRDDV